MDFTKDNLILHQLLCLAGKQPNLVNLLNDIEKYIKKKYKIIKKLEIFYHNALTPS